MAPTTPEHGVFYLLDEHGAFATKDEPYHCRRVAARDWLALLDGHGRRSLYRMARGQLFEILGITGYNGVAELLADTEKRRRASARATALFGAMFGVEGTPREVAARVKGYSRTADAVIRSLRDTLLAGYGSAIEMTNEIDMTSDPVELLLILFDRRYHAKARFEAKRKLVLMNLAAAIDQRERETAIEEKFRAFLEFLNDHVWSPDIRIGELDTVFLVSRHRPEDCACREVRVVEPAALAAVAAEDAGPYKKTLVKRRRFTSGGRRVPLYVSIRKKPPEAKVLKLLRKRQENPAAAVDDELGLMAVLDSRRDVDLFVDHLVQSAGRAGSFLALEDVSDTLEGGGHRSSSAGSDPGTRMFKFFARVGGMRVEFILHTNGTYLDYRLRSGIAHEEYEVKRFFDSGVAGLLFPETIYQLEMAAVRQDLLDRCRRRAARACGIDRREDDDGSAR